MLDRNANRAFPIVQNDLALNVSFSGPPASPMPVGIFSDSREFELRDVVVPPAPPASPIPVLEGELAAGRTLSRISAAAVCTQEEILEAGRQSLLDPSNGIEESAMGLSVAADQNKTIKRHVNWCDALTL